MNKKRIEELRVLYRVDLLIYLPAGAKKAVPVFLGLSFSGVHTVANDAGVPLEPQWVRGVKGPSPEMCRFWMASVM